MVSKDSKSRAGLGSDWLPKSMQIASLLSLFPTHTTLRLTPSDTTCTWTPSFTVHFLRKCKTIPFELLWNSKNAIEFHSNLDDIEHVTAA
jgi:hypothetical protein